MRQSRFPLFAFALTCIAVLASVPGRIISFARDVFDTLVLIVDPTAVRNLFDQPSIAFDAAGGDQVSAALAHSQRHEAGLSRLGAVRHC